MARAFEKFTADIAGDIFLRFFHQCLQGTAFGGKPEAIIDQFRIARDQRIAHMHDFPVHADTLDSAVGIMQNSSARCFINATRLHPDEAVFE